MNRLSSRQRKLVYFVAILLLLIPIFVLGRPASGNSGGGVLAELRRPQGQELGLSEHNLGRVDPTSAAMNLVLLGMRGVAVNLLWMDYIKQQETKNWAQVRSTTESITTSMRFNWIYRPGSDIYIAYDELRTDDVLLVDPALRHYGRMPWVQNRQIAVKMTYLLSR